MAVIIPALDEAESLALLLPQLACLHLGQVLVCDNGSTDATLEIAGRLSKEFPNVSFIRLEQRGRGRALKRAWTESKADIVAFMDVDLSTDLEALPGLIRAVDVEGYEIAIGSRLARGAVVTQRPFKRELFSRIYSLFVRASFLFG
ncbi:MAG: glycosyltransferase family 2 protein, partial [Proteobacteria bacterium]|nr:glycosyltransferase family 2 protein [Pseudomonadota bacterium]